MIKRQFYSLEHRSRDNEASSASSSSSSSASEGAVPSSAEDEAQSPLAHEQQEQQQHEEDDAEVSSPGPSFEVSDEDKGATDSNPDLAAGNKEDHDYDLHSINTSKKKKKNADSGLSNQWADLVEETLNEQAVDFADECVVQCKKVLKCRLCPKAICLSRVTMQAHLASKKHARSLKLLSEGRLKVMLNSDGEEEEQGETHAERHSRIVASFEKDIAHTPQKRKGISGRQRQRKRVKKKAKRSADG